MKTIFAIVILYFLFYGEPDIFDYLHHYAIQALKKN